MACPPPEAQRSLQKNAERVQASEDAESSGCNREAAHTNSQKLYQHSQNQLHKFA